MKTITQDIKNHSFKPVYLLSGEETYLTRQFCSKLAAAIAGDDEMNVNTFREKDPDIHEIISLADTLPFFAEFRLIVIEDSGFFKKDCSELADYLPGMPETTHIIFREDQVDKRGKLFKTVNSIGYYAEMNKQTPEDLQRWILTLLNQDNVKITRGAMNYLLDTVGTDMNVISNELDKLISYMNGRDVITVDDIDAICSRQITGHIFDMIEAMAVRNQKKAFRLYYDLLEMREPPMRILFLISKQYMQLYTIKELQAQGLQGKELASAAGLSSYAAKMTAQRASRLSIEEICSCMKACAEMEEGIKTGLIKDGIAVESLLAQCSRNR